MSPGHPRALQSTSRAGQGLWVVREEGQRRGHRSQRAQHPLSVALGQTHCSPTDRCSPPEKKAHRADPTIAPATMALSTPWPPGSPTWYTSPLPLLVGETLGKTSSNSFTVWCLIRSSHDMFSIHPGDCKAQRPRGCSCPDEGTPITTMQSAEARPKQRPCVNST